MNILLFILALFGFGIVTMLRSKLAFGDLTQSQKDEIIATTLDKSTSQLINQTLLSNSMYNFFANSPYRENVTGGHRIRFPFIIDTNDSYGWYGLGDSFSPQPQKILAWGHATLKQGAGDVTIEDLEEWMNSGEGAFVNMVQAKTDSLTQGIKNTLNINAWSDGTGSGGKEVTGLQGHIPTSPITGSYMGFSRVTEFWSRVWYDDGATVGPHDLDAPTGNAVQAVGSIGDISDGFPLITQQLNNLWRSIADGEDKSDIFHITDAQTMLWYKDIPLRCKGFEIGVHEGPFNIGIEMPHFMGSPIIDDTVNQGAVAGEWRTVNMKYYKMYVDTPHFFKWEGPRHPYNALRSTKYLIVRFQFVCTYPRKQGIMTGITTWQA